MQYYSMQTLYVLKLRYNAVHGIFTSLKAAKLAIRKLGVSYASIEKLTANKVFLKRQYSLFDLESPGNSVTLKTVFIHDITKKE